MTTPIKDQNGKGAKGLSRRELIRLGLKGGSIVVVSLASPTVLACVKPSSYGSLSSHSGPSKPTEYHPGWGPCTWCRDEWQYKEAWKSTGCVRDTHYDSYSRQWVTATKHIDRFSNGFDKQLLKSMQEDTEFAKACSAAYLNACSGKCNVMTPGEVHDMWKAIRYRGYYEPTAGMKWNEVKCTEYLRTTFYCT